MWEVMIVTTLERLETNIDNTMEMSAICRGEWCNLLEPEIDGLDYTLSSVCVSEGSCSSDKVRDLEDKIHSAYRNVSPRREYYDSGGSVMHNKSELCGKITSLYPDIGECGIDVDVDFDTAKNCWVVDLKKGKHELKHHLESIDADACMEGKQCVSLGLEIAQLRKNILGDQF